MKKIYKKQKRNYAKPQVEQIKLDNEISVFMASTPPGDPTFGPMGSVNTENFNADPFKMPKLS
jgi:hypothetical protein